MKQTPVIITDSSKRFVAQNSSIIYYDIYNINRLADINIIISLTIIIYASMCWMVPATKPIIIYASMCWIVPRN